MIQPGQIAYLEWTFKPLEQRNYKWTIPLITEDQKTFIYVEARGKLDLQVQEQRIHATPQLHLPIGDLEMIVSLFIRVTEDFIR